MINVLNVNLGSTSPVQVKGGDGCGCGGCGCGN